MGEDLIDRRGVAMDDLQTPAGAPAWRNNLPNSIAASGACSDGFKTKVLPQATASGNIQSGIIAGKLNGVTPATTPSGAA